MNLLAVSVSVYRVQLAEAGDERFSDAGDLIQGSVLAFFPPLLEPSRHQGLDRVGLVVTERTCALPSAGRSGKIDLIIIMILSLEIAYDWPTFRPSP